MADENTPLTTADDQSSPPLRGVRVLDLTQVIAGPYCTTMLADLGAEVVKIERPGVGDDLRTVGRYKGREEHEDYFYANNRNKKSVELDLKDSTHQEVGRALANRADVLVENFAPGTAERLGMGWADLHRLNPRLIYCSVSGFGQTGPHRNRLAVDSVVQGITGLMSVTGFPDGDPVIVGAPLTDVISGMFGAFAVLGALYSAQRDGKGACIDVAMQAATIAAIGPRMGDALQCRRAQPRMGNENPMRVPSDTYPTKDGRFICITVVNDRHWRPFCRAVGREEWIVDPRFATMIDRAKNRAELRRLADAAFRERSLMEWMIRLDYERVAHAPVYDYVEALDDPQIVHRGMVREVDHPRSGRLKVIGPPWITSQPSVAITPPPLLGQHTAEVLANWLGWSNDAIDEFMVTVKGKADANRGGGDKA